MNADKKTQMITDNIKMWGIWRSDFETTRICNGYIFTQIITDEKIQMITDKKRR